MKGGLEIMYAYKLNSTTRRGFVVLKLPKERRGLMIEVDEKNSITKFRDIIIQDGVSGHIGRLYVKFGEIGEDINMDIVRTAINNFRDNICGYPQ